MGEEKTQGIRAARVAAPQPLRAEGRAGARAAEQIRIDVGDLNFYSGQKQALHGILLGRNQRLAAVDHHVQFHEISQSYDLRQGYAQIDLKKPR